MEPAPIREEVGTFTRACQALAHFVHHHRLNERECTGVISFVRAIEMEVQPSVPLLTQDDPPLAATLSNVALID